MKKLLFIDHGFHLGTKSSNFFIDILKRDFDVNRYFIDETGVLSNKILDVVHNYEYIVLWQLDYLAPIFIALNKRTIVIPMYDGSANMPDIHWEISKKASFINFSSMLDIKVKAVCPNTLLLKYFIETDFKVLAPSLDGPLKAFLWERDPHMLITEEFVVKLLGNCINHLHIHRSPDNASNVTNKDSKVRLKNLKVTYSYWSDDNTIYLSHLNSSNIFVAPRLSEGIGMALLEAMSRGMLILAHDLPTNNEYILNNYNGILFNTSSSSVNIENAKNISKNALETSRIGFYRWEISKLNINKFIQSTLTPNITPSIDVKLFSKKLCIAYNNGINIYEKFLRKNIYLINEPSGNNISKNSEHNSNNTALDAFSSLAKSNSVPQELLICNKIDLSCDHYFKQGWSNYETGFRWMIGTRGLVVFSLEKTFNISVLHINVRSLPRLKSKTNFCVRVNQFISEIFSVSTAWKSFYIHIPNSALKSTNDIEIISSQSTRLLLDRRLLSLCFSEIELL